ncbi:MAG: hypothetical protein IPH88_08715 [Bacteroidales bacterium]|nr:hypothetical protein [Bacteroidales bacterium]
MGLSGCTRKEKLNRVVSAMAALRKTDAFRYGSFTSDLGQLGKKIWIAHSSMDVVISVNMGVNGFIMSPGFTKTGTWYDYFTGESFNVTDPGGHYFYYNPGDYRVFTSVPMPRPFYNLNITVIDSLSGSPIPDANVQLRNAGNRTTGTNGDASFTALPKRDYVTASKFGWITKTADTLVGANTNLTIALRQGWDPSAGWANLQSPGSGSIQPGNDFNVYAQAWIDGVTTQTAQDTTLLAWIGYDTTNSDPATWTHWIPATYHTAVGNNDEYMANLGIQLTTEGTYYYASRFRKDNGPYVYGGYSAGTGGFWNGTSNVSGVVSVQELPQPVIGWVNLQYPGSGIVAQGQAYNVYAQAFIQNITGQAIATPGLQGWIGYNTSNTNPATWTNWIPASYNAAAGNNDEFVANLGAQISTNGTYYYASRFKYNDGAYLYGGYSATTGGFWDGTTNVNGVLTVSSSAPTTIDWANLQWPGEGTISASADFSVYGQVYVAGLTGQSAQAPGLQAWVGYSTDNTNPSSWTNWLPANYNVAAGNNDEFNLNLGTQLATAGTYYYVFRYRMNNGSFYYGGYSAGGGGFWDGTQYISGVLNVTSSAKTLNLKAFVEGLYAGSGVMNKAQGNSGEEYAGTIADKVSIELHDGTTGALVYSISSLDLNTNGTITTTIPSVHNGSYYIYLRHRNSLVTSTADPVSFSGSSITYDFSTAADKAFASNLILVGGVAVLYGGDVNQDGIVDSGDMIGIDNDAAAFVTGYLDNDVNGDGLLDSGDMIIVDNNATAFVGAVLPF